ncbi:MAG: dihydroorotate dehydrogenase electron transfer subunit [Desulfobacteraceae bacterium]|jgi:dihydroorotate dehydrogenase electron transfer subunit
MIENSIKILSNSSVAPDTFLIRLHSPELAASAKPGQFLMLKINDCIDPVLRRPFSICGVEGDNTIKILYKVVGKGTGILSGKKTGENLSVLGPLGTGFKTPDQPCKIFLVAGGIGIAPLLFLYQNTKSSDITFLTGFRTSSEIINPSLTGNKINNLISTDDGSAGYNGRVTDLLIKNLEQYRQKDVSIYTCGPLPMLKAVRDVSLKYRIPCQVSMETFMACGLGACQGCVVRSDISKTGRPYLHVCKEGPVLDINEIDWENI